MSKEYDRDAMVTIPRTSVSSKRSRKCSTISYRPTAAANKAKVPVPVRVYQPTYQLNPRQRFKVEHVQKVLKRIVDSELEEVEYNEKVVPEVCMSLAEIIRNVVKEEFYDRYRIIVCVSIGQKRQQGVHVYHGFLWDGQRDAFATYNYENCHIYANVVVYGIYLD